MSSLFPQLGLPIAVFPAGPIYLAQLISHYGQ